MFDNCLELTKPNLAKFIMFCTRVSVCRVGGRPAPPGLQAVDVVLEAVAAHGVAAELLRGAVLDPAPLPPCVPAVHHKVGVGFS